MEAPERGAGAGAGSIRQRFREANERIEADRRALGVEGRVPYVCECEDGGCMRLVLLSAEEYGRVRAEPRRTVVAAGHVGVDERIVEEGTGYVIVERGGSASGAA